MGWHITEHITNNVDIFGVLVIIRLTELSASQNLLNTIVLLRNGIGGGFEETAKS